MIAPAQVGQHPENKWCYGRSMIVDPWGTVIATAPDTETVVSANLDFQRLRDVRRQVPSLANRQPDAYALPETEREVASRPGGRAAAR
jgi:predicted amidohydrolase